MPPFEHVQIAAADYLNKPDASLALYKDTQIKSASTKVDAGSDPQWGKALDFGLTGVLGAASTGVVATSLNLAFKTNFATNPAVYKSAFQAGLDAAAVSLLDIGLDSAFSKDGSKDAWYALKPTGSDPSASTLFKPTALEALSIGAIATSMLPF